MWTHAIIGTNTLRRTPLKSCTKPFPHEQAKRCRGITVEEEVSYPETLICAASTAVWLGNDPRHRQCRSWLPAWSTSGADKSKDIVCRTADVQGRDGREWLWGGSSGLTLLCFPLGCLWHFSEEQIGFLWCRLLLWLPMCHAGCTPDGVPRDGRKCGAYLTFLFTSMRDVWLLLITGSSFHGEMQTKMDSCC